MIELYIDKFKHQKTNLNLFFKEKEKRYF